MKLPNMKCLILRQDRVDSAEPEGTDDSARPNNLGDCAEPDGTEGKGRLDDSSNTHVFGFLSFMVTYVAYVNDPTQLLI